MKFTFNILDSATIFQGTKKNIINIAWERSMTTPTIETIMCEDFFKEQCKFVKAKLMILEHLSYIEFILVRVWCDRFHWTKKKRKISMALDEFC